MMSLKEAASGVAAETLPTIGPRPPKLNPSNTTYIHIRLENLSKHISSYPLEEQDQVCSEVRDLLCSVCMCTTR